jgi:hypothetical protein
LGVLALAFGGLMFAYVAIARTTMEAMARRGAIEVVRAEIQCKRDDEVFRSQGLYFGACTPRASSEVSGALHDVTSTVESANTISPVAPALTAAFAVVLVITAMRSPLRARMPKPIRMAARGSILAAALTCATNLVAVAALIPPRYLPDDFKGQPVPGGQVADAVTVANLIPPLTIAKGEPSAWWLGASAVLALVAAGSAYALLRRIRRHPELLGPERLQEFNGKAAMFDAMANAKRSYVDLLRGNGATPAAVAAAEKELAVAVASCQAVAAARDALATTLQQLQQRQQYVNLLVVNKGPANDVAAARAALEQVFVDIEARASAPISISVPS